MRGGANGARLNLAPQKDWAANSPTELKTVLARLSEIRDDFNKSARRNKKVSLADLIVLGGAAAIEQSAKNAGTDIEVPFAPGRTDASQAQTDTASFALLEPRADGFRNFYSATSQRAPADLLVERAGYLNLTVPEMTVLLGGLRTLNANTNGSKHGVFTDRPEVLSTDFFVNLLDMSTEWQHSATDKAVFEGIDRTTKKVKWTATPVDLAVGASSELRAIAEVYAADDAKEKFITDFVAAWTKVMRLDRFDL